MFRTLSDIKRAHDGHWFDTDTLRFFRSRISEVIHPDGNGGAYFVSSERYDSQSPRLYTVRHADASGEIRTVGAFQQFASASGAHGRAAAYATGRRPEPAER